MKMKRFGFGKHPYRQVEEFLIQSFIEVESRRAWIEIPLSFVPKDLDFSDVEEEKPLPQIVMVYEYCNVVNDKINSYQYKGVRIK